MLLSDATEGLERIAKYSSRLTEVRQRRAAMAAAIAAAEAAAAGAAPADNDLFADDLASEAPSMISGFSIYTDRTSAGASGAFGSSAASSSRAPSTLGGRKAMRKERKKAGKKGGKIRAGAPGEEAALEAHLLSLAPAQHVLEEAGQLTELLVMLQHSTDAAKLQQRVGQWQAAAAEAAEVVAAGQQQQQQGLMQGGGTAAATAAAAAKQAQQAVAAAAAVHWKWDVLREHKQ